MRRNSKSTNSLLSLGSTVGSNNSTRSDGSKRGTSLSGGIRMVRLPFLSKRKGNISRVAHSIGRRCSASNIQTVQKNDSIPRNSKSMTSLNLLETERSSWSSFSHLVTPDILSVLEQIDSSLVDIGVRESPQIPRIVSNSTICELSEHEADDEFVSPFIEDLSPLAKRNPTSTTRRNCIQRVHRNDFHHVCRIGNGRYSNVDMVLDSKREKYVLKSLDASRLKTSEAFLIAALDLAMEAKILSELDHENIIQLRGVCSRNFSSSYTEGDRSGYFLVFDLLHDVLSDRLDRWRKNNRKKSSYDSKWKYRKSKVDTQEMYERMRNVALGMVKGMMYLQEIGVVLRDLKPANVGFDEEGNVRLFDFGMAQKLEDCNPNEICGSPRYMPPEVMAGKGYSYKSDVYSFGLTLYEICSLNVAFDSIRKYDNRDEFNRLVIEQNMRPNLGKIACPLTIQLIEDCWQGDPTQRPSFNEIYARLIEITACQNASPFEITG